MGAQIVKRWVKKCKISKRCVKIVNQKVGGSKGGRGVGGKVNLPPIKVLITPRRVGEL